jgi:hypothetical protein
MSTLRLAPPSVEAGTRWTARFLTIPVVTIVVTFFIGEGGFNPLTLTPVEAVLMVFLGAICLGMAAAWRWELIGGTISVAAVPPPAPPGKVGSTRPLQRVGVGATTSFDACRRERLLLSKIYSPRLFNIVSATNLFPASLRCTRSPVSKPFSSFFALCSFK